MNSDTEPKLAPPGAGLPFPENLIARLMLGTKRLTGNRNSFTKHLIKERKAIFGLLKNQDPLTLSRRVLIRRPPGLEDSSRYWSVLMTLDHLRIVHHEFIRVLQALAAGHIPDGKASTAAVKPDPYVTDEVIHEYEASCDALLSAVAAIPNLKTRVRFVHPWFGAMDAFGWLALAGGHMGIHRIQIERILRGSGIHGPKMR